MEKAHKLAREHSEGEMKRQKKYHDNKLSWECFEPGDKVLVYFPQRITCKSPKLMTFWRGLYDVISRKSAVTYEVGQPQDKKTQIVHVDRLRKYRSQQLVGENVNEAMKSKENIEQDKPPEDDIAEEEYEFGQDMSSRHGENSCSSEELKSPYIVDSNANSRSSRTKKMPSRFADNVLNLNPQD